MANKSVSLTDANGNNIYPIPFEYVRFGHGAIHNASSASYTVFAKLKVSETGSTYLMRFLVSNVGGTFYANGGLFYVQAFSRNNSMSITVHRLVTGVGIIRFGYYDGGDGYYYLGVYRSATYGSAPAVFAPFISSLADVTFGSFYDGTTAPEGWTEIGFDGDGALAFQNSITSLANLKTYMSEWYSSQGQRSTGYYTATMTGTVSPFPASARLSIQINAANDNGTALITVATASGARVFVMAYTGGAWTDPKELATL